MTPTSATKAERAEVCEVLALISRRASHELRNALNSVAVNIEVVRSRLARPAPDLAELQTFADRASRESEVVASLATGLADLTGLLARLATADHGAMVTRSAGSTIASLPLCSTDDHQISGDLQALAARMGVAIKVNGSTVIFTVRD